MAEIKKVTGMTIDEVLGNAVEMPAKDLPLYLESYRDILPGFDDERMQIMTREELSKLPRAEAARCRTAFMMRYSDMAKNRETQNNRKTA